MISQPSSSSGACLAALGNPGSKYALNRHNAGRIFLDHLIRKWKAGKREVLKDCAVRRGERNGISLVFAEAMTYMNENGPPLTELVKSLDISPDQFLVLHDDIDLPLGRVQLKRGGSSAGHRGVESLYQALGNPDFYRLRIGVGRPAASARDYVLSDFEPAEMASLESIFEKSGEGLDFWIKGNFNRAGQILNSIGEPPKNPELEIK